MKKTLVVFSIFYFAALICDADCRDLTEKVSNAYVTAWDDPCVYRERYCALNVIRLYNYLKKMVPELEPEDFKVIYVTRPGGWDYYIHEFDKDFSVLRSRVGLKKAKVLNWRYHVALEYQNRIFDLDFNDHPTISTKDQYVSDLFVSRDLRSEHINLSGSIDELAVYSIAGNRYLLARTTKAQKKEFHDWIFRNVVPTPLANFARP
jgi:hypothetical protein